MKQFKVALLLLLVSTFFYACNRGGNPVTPVVHQTKLKVINSATNYSTLSVKIDNETAASLAFANMIPYKTLTAGLHKMVVRTPAGVDSLHHENTLTENVAYTWFILDGTPLSVLPAVDNLDVPPGGKAKVRVSNFSDIDTINIRIAGGSNLITGVNNGAVWGYAIVNSGTYNLEIRDYTTDALYYTQNNVILTDQKIYDLVVTGYEVGTGQQAIRFTLYNQ